MKSSQTEIVIFFCFSIIHWYAGPYVLDSENVVKDRYYELISTNDWENVYTIDAVVFGPNGLPSFGRDGKKN